MLIHRHVHRQVLVEFSDDPFIASVVNTASKVMRDEQNAAASDPLAKKPAGTSKMKSGKFVGVVDGFKTSLKSLITTLQDGDLHFIRCLKPNDSKAAGIWDRDVASRQLQSAGLVHAVAATRSGYSDHLPPVHIINAYGSLCPDVPTEGMVDTGTAQAVLEGCGVGEDMYVVGATKIFLKQGVLDELQRLRLEHIGDRATLVQGAIRVLIAKRMLKKLREEAQRKAEERRQREEELRRQRAEAERRRVEAERREREEREKAEAEELERRKQVQKARSLSFDRKRRKKKEEEERIEREKQAQSAEAQARTRREANAARQAEADARMQQHLYEMGATIDATNDNGTDLARAEAAVARAEAEAAAAAASSRFELQLPNSPDNASALPTVPQSSSSGSSFKVRLRQLSTKPSLALPSRALSYAIVSNRGGRVSRGASGLAIEQLTHDHSRPVWRSCNSRHRRWICRLRPPVWASWSSSASWTRWRSSSCARWRMYWPMPRWWVGATLILILPCSPPPSVVHRPSPSA